MIEEKNNSKLISIVMLFVGIIIGVGGFYSFKVLSGDYDKKDENKITKPVELKESKVKDLYNRKDENKNYLVRYYESGISLYPNNDNISFDLEYDVNSIAPMDNYHVKKNYKFNKEYKTIMFGGIGQAFSLDNEFIIALCNDGTIEYYPLKDIETLTKPKELTLKNIEVIEKVDVSLVEGSGYASIIAIDNENNSYDLYDYLINAKEND